MKLEYLNDKIIIYLYNEKLTDNSDLLKEKIKKIIIKLIKNYHLNLFGYLKLNIYENDKYGLIMEIDKVNNVFNIDIIDLKIVIYPNVNFYLEISDDLYIDNFKNSIYKDNKFYINIDNLDNLLKYLEYGRIIYHNPF